ncbi:hypothetical protein H634G_06443 [Metarhizium anisopliae BRIP 53293]|uniref:HypA protein n=1 Tax=Metarhizium anisopliae BRIP 53293 TaxID=1291518 RepID=A0A0D9P0A8_METAN|nr:hypothetical protein H634G_06443 [Metarhizium anisopliae BRIP 53293]KJK90459.1 hypothetical protein H633G_05638 [Metarhizium anisopliae BRIP 53284]
MSTSTKIVITPENTGLWNIQQSEEAAQAASELLQKDLEGHHVFLNNKGFHDHMLHHIIALYGTGASVTQLRKAYDIRHPLQRPTQPPHDDVAAQLRASWSNSVKYLGQEQYYPDFLAYFQSVIRTKGYESVVNEYLFKGDAAADDLLVRLHAGVLHPLIQLMYGLEWKQPAVVAEALAETCVHPLEGLDRLLLPSERRGHAPSPRSQEQPLLSIYHDIRSNHDLSVAMQIDDGADKIQAGVLKRAREPMLKILERVSVNPSTLDERTVEMMHAIIYIGSGAAIHPPQHVKYDFSLMHHINSSLIYLVINKQNWISLDTKARMLEWKIRMDLLQYVAQASPAFSVESILNYTPKLQHGSMASVRDIGVRLQSFGDDGHAIKQARATAICHELMKKYEIKPWAVLKGDEIWKKIQHMVVDAVEGPGVLYVRCAGLQGVWKDVPLQSRPRRPSNVLESLQTGSGSSEEALRGYV